MTILYPKKFILSIKMSDDFFSHLFLKMLCIHQNFQKTYLTPYFLLLLHKCGLYFYMTHHYKNFLSSLHSSLHHCTSGASLHVKTNPVNKDDSESYTIRDRCYYNTLGCLKLFGPLFITVHDGCIRLLSLLPTIVYTYKRIVNVNV